MQGGSVKRDFNGLLNLLIGIFLVLIVGIYQSSMPVFVLVVVSVSGCVLIAREVWLHAGMLRWSLTPRAAEKGGLASYDGMQK